MAWRRRRFGRVGSSVYRALQQAKALQRKQAYMRRVKRQAAVGRKLTTFLRSQGIAKGQLYSLTPPVPIPDGTVIPKLTRSQLKAYAAEGKYVGRGGYNMRKFRRDMGQLGRVIGAPILGAVENKIVSGISGAGLYSGRGAYTNELFSGGSGSLRYSAPNDETSDIVISHREYMQDIFGAPNSGYNVEGWALNPALMENFPYLSQLACNYEEYEFIQLVFEFKSTVDASAVNNTSGATGTLIMCTNYNPSAPLFTNKEQAMQYHGSNSGRVVDDHCHGVECDPTKNAGSAQKLTRTTPVVQNQDIKAYDLGIFQLAQTNIPSAFQNQQIGELWVSYTVRLSKPRLFAATGSAVGENRWFANTGCSSTNWLGTAPLYMQQNTYSVNLSTFTNGVAFNLPDFMTGVFDIQILLEGTFTGMAAAFGFGGNTAAYKDLLAASVTPAGGAANSPNYITWVSDGNALNLIARIRVQPVTGGVDNLFSVTLTGTYTLSNVQIIMRQTNPSIAASTSNAVPLYVNSVGVVTTTPL